MSNLLGARLGARILAALSVIAALALPVLAKEPRVPPGLSATGAITIALIGPGIDYRVPELKDSLARDGEGDLISWDFSDADNKPFETQADGFGTKSAISIALQAPKTLIVVAKERPTDSQAFGYAMQFVARTPARIVVWSGADPARPDWPIFAEAVKRFRSHLFVIPAGDTGRALDSLRAFKSLRGAENLLVVTSRGQTGTPNTGKRTVDVTVIESKPDELANSWQAALAIAALAARILDRDRRQTPKSLKQLITAPAPAGLAIQPNVWRQKDAYSAFRSQ